MSLLFQHSYILTLQFCKYDANIKLYKFCVLVGNSHMTGWMESMSLALWFSTSTKWFCTCTAGWILLDFFASSNRNISDKLIYLFPSFLYSAYVHNLTPCISFILRSLLSDAKFASVSHFKVSVDFLDQLLSDVLMLHEKASKKEM